jgi:molybdenum-dependent DNA-binding transcriptional regulator ModE
MLEDFRIQVFMTVAHERSFTKAAAVLGVSQPAVSQNVAELEKLVGAKLFERLRGEVALTGEGEVFKQYAEKMLASCTGLDNMFAKIAPTVVRISASEELYNYMVSPALESFRKIHPEVIFERAMFEGADLLISLKPVPSSAYDIPADSIARIRMSVFPTPTVGSVLGGSASGSQSGSRSVSGSQSFERTSCFDVLFQPTPLFACTRLCRLIREFLVGAKI